jgi:PIN domain nuclease of toxin-antitoxin system
MKILLDTHAWIWWHADPGKLSKKALRAIKTHAPNEGILLSAISVWELCKLVEKGRIALSLSPDLWIREALKRHGCRVIPLRPSIAYHSTILPQPFHHDPADQIIVATAREENAVIVTKDGLIQAYPHVQTLW